VPFVSARPDFTSRLPALALDAARPPRYCSGDPDMEALELERMFT
jgi:hypothetical protein